MAERPPWLPLPSTSLSTIGSTAPSSWPSAPLNAGEFSNESRIPMVEPLSLGAQIRFQIQTAFGSRRQAAKRPGFCQIRTSGGLELLDDEGFGQTRFGPFRKRRK